MLTIAEVKSIFSNQYALIDSFTTLDTRETDFLKLKRELLLLGLNYEAIIGGFSGHVSHTSLLEWPHPTIFAGDFRATMIRMGEMAQQQCIIVGEKNVVERIWFNGKPIEKGINQKGINPKLIELNNFSLIPCVSGTILIPEFAWKSKL